MVNKSPVKESVCGSFHTDPHQVSTWKTTCYETNRLQTPQKLGKLFTTRCVTLKNPKIFAIKNVRYDKDLIK